MNKDTVQTPPTAHRAAVLTCAWSPDGSWMASASADGDIRIWDFATATERTNFEERTDSQGRCAISPDGSWIVSTRAARWVDDEEAIFTQPSVPVGTFCSWDATTGMWRTSFDGHADSATDCAVSPDGRWIVSASNDKTLKIWDAAGGKARRTLTGHTGNVNACAVSPDGLWIVSASDDKTLRIWDSAGGLEEATLAGHRDWVRSCAVSPDGTWIVSGGTSESLKIWDVATRTERVALVGHGPSSHYDSRIGCAASPDGAWVVSAAADRTLRVWDAATGIERFKLGLPAEGTSAGWHPLEPVVGCGDIDGGVHFARLVGLELGPLVVTADDGSGLTVSCPACREAFEIGRESLGSESACPRPACGRRLRINAFVLGHPV